MCNRSLNKRKDKAYKGSIRHSSTGIRESITIISKYDKSSTKRHVRKNNIKKDIIRNCWVTLEGNMVDFNSSIDLAVVRRHSFSGNIAEIATTSFPTRANINRMMELD